MHGDDPQALARRMNDLETEMRALRERVARLEGVPATSAPLAPARPAAVAPAAPVAAPAVPSAPPPIPPVARQPAPPVAVAATVPQPVATVAPRSPEPTEPSVLGQILGALHLVPPSGGGAGEAQLGAWWATRIGAVLAVIGVVFFGVYISLDTPPWVKLVELAIVAAGVTLAGGWLERKVGRPGAVVLGAGLALCFFTAFAAYAVPAVKVIDSIVVGALVQAAAVAGIAGAALWRRSATVATMAVLLGFVAAFFSLTAGFDDFAVVAGVALAGLAVFFRRREGWVAPLLASAVLAHLLNAAVAVHVWDTEAGERSAWWMFGAVAAVFFLHLLTVMLEGGGERGRVATAQRWVQAINASLAVLAGLAVALVALPDDGLSGYFFGAGAVMLAAASWAWRAVPRDGIFGMFAVKAASLIALGVITEWDARTRWVALLVQAAVILAAAWRTRHIALVAAAVLAWFVSLVFFGEDVLSSQLVWLSTDGLAALLYVTGGTALLAWAGRWPGGDAGASERRVAVSWILGAVGAIPVLLLVVAVGPEAWAALALAGLAVVLAGVARWMRSVVPTPGVGVAILAAHGLVQFFDESGGSAGWLWAGAVAAAVVSIAAGWRAGAHDGANREGAVGAAALLHVLALAALAAAALQTLVAHAGLALAVGIAVAGTVAGVQAMRRDLLLAGSWGLAVAYGLFVVHRPGFFIESGHGGWLWLAATGGPVVLALAGGAVTAGRSVAVARAIAGVAAVALAWLAIGRTVGTMAVAWVALGVAGVFLAVGWWRGCAVARVAASAVLVLTLGRHLERTLWAALDGAWLALAAVFSVCVALAALPIAQARVGGWLRPGAERAWRVGHVVAAAVCLMVVATLGRAVWQAQASVVWALGGVALFVVGLAGRSRAHRIVGLIVLGLCIPRVFVVDIQSMAHRIGAFVVLGVVLLVVGFSYQKFRHWIEGPREDVAGDPKAPAATPPPPPPPVP